MTQLSAVLPLFVALLVTPAFAAEPDPHAGHHPPANAEAVKPAAAPAAPVAQADPKAAMHACPMMDGKMTGEPGAAAGMGMDGKMMMDGMDMHCMAPPAAAKGADAPHDHAPSDAPK